MSCNGLLVFDIWSLFSRMSDVQALFGRLKAACKIHTVLHLFLYDVLSICMWALVKIRRASISFVQEMRLAVLVVFWDV
jgi:hypothetical protein